MNLQKYTPQNLEFCNDYGEQPLLLAHLTKDRSTIAVLSLLGGFVAMAAVGFPGALLVGFAALNDISYAAKVEGLDDAPETVKDDQGAIDVMATTVDNDQGATQSIAAAPSMSHIVSPVWNPAEDLGQNPQSALIVGVPGSGKGMLVSNAIRTLKAKYPDLKIFVIDPKASPKERGYWEGISDVYRAFSLKNCADPDEGAEWLLGCMAEFTTMPGPKLCIFDELMTAATELELADRKYKALARLKKFIVGLVGQGDSEEEWLWAMSQSPHVKDLGTGGGVRANLRAIGLVSPKNLAAVTALTSTDLIPPPPGGMDELRQIMENSPVNRAVFDGKISRWLPMPRLENHSGFDRDSRTMTRETSTATIAPPPSTSTAAPMGTGRRPTRIRLGASSATPDRAWSTVPAEKVPDAPLDPAIELINAEPNIDRRDALTIAYLWAQGKLDKGEEVSRSAFLERARKERKSEYLENNRDEVWEDLQTLID